MGKQPFTLYHKYHLERDDERFGMFEILADRFAIERILYPGSFVHITPSFVFPQATYVDMEKRAKAFFTSLELQPFIAKHQVYSQEAQIQFHHQDYTKPLPEQDESFDLLISQYAGFVSQNCKRYLKIGGCLLANNSHGDAGMAALDEDYVFAGAINRRGETFRFSEINLDEYFIPKKDILVTKAYLTELQRGIAYQKSAFAYIFVRTR